MTDTLAAVEAALADTPVVAILRGLDGGEAVGVVQALYDAGIRIAEVPLNSPDPFATIALLRSHFGAHMMIGAGTVIDPADVDRLADAGGQICVAPNCDIDVIGRALDLGIVPMPGIASPSDAFRAYRAGARWLKYFPAGEVGLAAIGALRPVMPTDARFVAVGGVGATNASRFLNGGCDAIGVGSELYRPGRNAAAVGHAADTLIAAMRERQREPRVVANPGATISESPLMDPTGKHLLFVDPVRSNLHRVTLVDGTMHRVATDVPLNAIGWRGDTLVGLADYAVVTVDRASGATTPIVDVDVGSGCRFNDMTIGADGTIWAGTMHRGLLAGRGTLFRIGVDGSVTRVCEGLGACNGMEWTRDGTSLYLVDTLQRTLIRFPSTPFGALGEPQIVSDFMSIPGKPDGMTIGADGNPLVAMWGGGRVVELAPNGAHLRSHRVAAPHVSSVCTDGKGGLIVTTSRMRLTPQVADATGSGSVFEVALAGPSGRTNDAA
ncbi:2-dehydro-3-deoxy-6-phosphogalactonate aldolase [Sphingomonas sp. ST-64]|uniref:2-dehydro-3-deoxy-6-phosphogalactonate aldolase n=1 Tax=Sphingomonas plantiphila TaxID=3163295 RepID=A0ABW8YIA0_9SPHN